jgi:hypothetical protein
LSARPSRIIASAAVAFCGRRLTDDRRTTYIVLMLHPSARSWLLCALLLGAGCPPAEGPGVGVTDPPVADSDPHSDPTVPPDTDPAALPVHRLSARELSHTLRDVLGVDIDVASWLPEDTRVDGFEHLEGVTSTSAAWVEALYPLAREVAARVDATPSPVSATARLEYQGEALWWSAGVPSGSLAVLFDAVWATDRSTSTRIELPEGATWTPTVWLVGQADANEDLTAQVWLDDDLLGTILFERRTNALRTSVSGAPVSGGWHDLTITVSPDRSANPPLTRPELFAVPPFVGVDEVHFVADAAPATEGPPPRAPRLVCKDGAPVRDACADEAIGTLARRLWRREPASDEVAGLRVVYDAGRELEASPADALRDVVVALLVSPSFYFRRELARDVVLPPDAYAIASRLSYAVWSSAPDDTLLACASDGSLLIEAGPCGRTAQVARMLADPRADALIDDFTLQWLALHDVETLWVHASYHPRWTPELFADLKAETRSMIAAARDDRRDLRDLLVSETSTASWRVAVLYGAEPASFEAENVIDLALLGRPGLLGQGAVLAATARGSPPTAVDRAVWVMRNLLCQEPPQPPPDVPPLDRALDPRDALAAHVSDPACASCHRVIDPLGMPLDGFDLLGQRVDPDPTVTQLDGTVVDSVGEYARWLRERPELAACMTRRTATWVLGRVLTTADESALDGMRDRALAEGFDLASVVRAVVADPRFTATLEAR